MTRFSGIDPDMHWNLPPATAIPHPVSATEPDWSREEPRRYWDPSRRLLRTIRDYQGAGGGALGFLRRKVAVLRYRFWSIVTQTDIPLNCKIGGGLLIPHPNGIVIHEHVLIGPNCLIMQQVTIGVSGTGSGAPRLGGHADIGAGAKVLGAVHVENHAQVGANAVVLDDVPPGGVAVGIPARVVKSREGSIE